MKHTYSKLLRIVTQQCSPYIYCRFQYDRIFPLDLLYFWSFYSLALQSVQMTRTMLTRKLTCCSTSIWRTKIEKVCF